MKRATMAGLIAVIVVVHVAAGALLAYTPPQRGQPDYPEHARASYQSVGTRYADLIERQDWARLLDELEAEFFAGADSNRAEKSALIGYQRARERFLESLDMRAESQIAKAGGDLAILSPSAKLTEFVAMARHSDPLPGSITAMYRSDIDLDGVESVFDQSVVANQDSRDFGKDRLDELFMLSETIYSLLQDAMVPYREATLQAIRAARQRWSDFTDHAMVHQFPWELTLNQSLGLTGNLETPPDRQVILLHPLLAVEFADPEPADAWRPFDEATVEDAMQVNLLGCQWLDGNEGFARRFSISGCISYRSDVTRPGLGVSLGLKRWVDVGIIHRQLDGQDSYSVIFSADFWGLIKKEQSGFVRKSARWLEEAEGLLN